MLDTPFPPPLIDVIVAGGKNDFYTKHLMTDVLSAQKKCKQGNLFVQFPFYEENLSYVYLFTFHLRAFLFNILLLSREQSVARYPEEYPTVARKLFTL